MNQKTREAIFVETPRGSQLMRLTGTEGAGKGDLFAVVTQSISEAGEVKGEPILVALAPTLTDACVFGNRFPGYY